VLSHDELDAFYDPLVYGVAEDIHNTRHGNLPGHKQLWFTETLTEPTDHRQDIIQANWETKWAQMKWRWEINEDEGFMGKVSLYHRIVKSNNNL